MRRRLHTARWMRPPAAAALLSLLSSCALFSRPVEVEHPRVQHPSGVEYEDVVLGVGRAARRGREITVDYLAHLEDGLRFDSSLDRGVPLSFVLGQAPLSGWDKGIPGMREGGRRRLYVPPELAYGRQGVPGLVPPDAALIFDIDLLDVVVPGKEAGERRAPPD